MARIFLSYSRSDEPFARQLATSLSNLGADVWIDVEDIPVGMKWSRAIQEGLDVSDVLLVVISPESMASHNVEDEWQYYLDQKKPVIPLLYRPAKLHFQLSRIQYVDFNRQPYDKAVRLLHAELGRKGVRLNPLPKHSTLTQPVMRVPTDAPQREARRTLPITWLAAGAVLLVIGVGLGLFLSNPDRFTASPAPTNTPPASAPTHTPPGNAAPSPLPTQAVVPTADTAGNRPVYQSGGARFEYPQGWVADSISEGSGRTFIVANTQATLNTWISEDFDLGNGVSSGEVAIGIVPNIENEMLLDPAHTAWDVAYLLQQSLISSGYYFSDVTDYPARLGAAAYTLGNSDSYTMELMVIKNRSDGGFVLIFGAAAFDRLTELSTAIGLIADTLEL